MCTGKGLPGELGVKAIQSVSCPRTFDPSRSGQRYVPTSIPHTKSRVVLKLERFSYL